MEGGFATIILACNLLLLASPSFALPLCTDSRAPLTLNATLKFCSYNGRTCCNSTQDSQLEKQFRAMNISNPKCASLLKSVVCAKCDPFSANLYRIDSTPRSVPVLCNSTVSQTSSQSSQAENDFCSQLWDTCQSVSVLDSPFNPELQGRVGRPVNSHLTKLAGIWQTKRDFCDAFGGASTDGLFCFNGEPVALNDTATSSPSTHGLCFEKIGNGSYINMVAHPDGSNRAFFSNQQGKVWLATIPEQGSGGTLGLDDLNPFIDITDNVQFDAELGMMGMAFHPNFAQNGRFFISFNCDKVKWPGCAGRCSCNSDANCDPSKLFPDDGTKTCQYHSVIAEYTVNGTARQASSATKAKPSEVRRIFTMGLPFSAHHGGQILFGPKDGYLYFMMGDGGGVGDPYNFAQNKKSLLGKIMRLDVDNIPSTAEIDTMGLWGNYSIPKDNPFLEDGELQPEIWALGLRNPWRCSFDSKRSSYFICGDCGQDTYEEVDLITKGGNYGWRIFEGPDPYTPPSSPGGNTSVTSINPIFPVIGYHHSEVNSNEGSASIAGGYIYRSMTDPCMYGRYLFADLYAAGMWTGIEEPENSSNFTSSKVPFTCASDSPIACGSVPGSDVPSLGYIFSFGEDNRRDIFLLASSGVYRVVAPSRCKYACSKETAVPAAGPSPSSNTAPQASKSPKASNKYKPVFVLWKILLLLWLL